jgi:HCOMODA/2-hydroxy-3-carboxy-muconic semialdehyde decarboxylase
VISGKGRAVDLSVFLISRSLAPSQVTEADIQVVDTFGAAVDDERPPYLERFIHGSIYKRNAARITGLS